MATVKEQHKVRKAKQADAEKAQHAQKHKIQEAIQQIKNDTFAPRGQEESEAYFLQQVGAGEALAGQGLPTVVHLVMVTLC